MPYENTGMISRLGVFCHSLQLASGLLLTLGIEGKRRWEPAAMICGFCAANACLIVSDCAADPTNHNLRPFEFINIALATSPAFIGAGISRLLARRTV